MAHRSLIYLWRLCNNYNVLYSMMVNAEPKPFTGDDLGNSTIPYHHIVLLLMIQQSSLGHGTHSL